MISFNQLPSITGGEIIQLRKDLVIRYLLFDSRKPVISPGSLFFCIRGERRDGHQFVAELYEKGIRQFVVQTDYEVPSVFSEANFIRVPDPVEALQKIAAWHRRQFSFPVLAITGSNGKTIVKEWLFQALNDRFFIVRSPRSFNSQIGVPLSVWQMEDAHDLAVFEAGISQIGEMEKLEAIIQPDYGIFTNIGSAHDEGFESKEQKIREKLRLFRGVRKLIYHTGQQEAAYIIRSEIPSERLFSWGEDEDADVRIRRKTINDSGMEVELEVDNGIHILPVPFSDPASFENAMHCIALMLLFDIPFQEISARIARLRPAEMRLELKEGIQGSYLIDDAYNNDLAGLSTALQFLEQQNQRERKTLILSDILQTGVEPQKLYAQVAQMVKENQLAKVIGVGEELSRFAGLFPSDAHFFRSTEDFLNSSVSRAFSREMILVKGARLFAFEKIIQRLTERVHGTVLEVNLDALSHNLNFYRSFLKPETRIMVMVKAFAYGSGGPEVSNLLQFHKVDYLAVAYPDEGIQLRNQGIHLPVMVMNPSLNAFEKMIEYKLEPELYSLAILRDFIRFSEDVSAPLSIHLKLDTGMHRLGFEEKDISLMLELLKEVPHIRVKSVFTHLAAADEASFNSFTQSQVSAFIRMYGLIEEGLGYAPIRHVLNSAGIVRFPDFQMDLVRLGIGLYGVEANGLAQEKLRTVGTLKTVISQIKELESGDTVGYSRKGKISGPSKIATISIGYADGYDRRLGNGVGNVSVNGMLCPVIGNVCMDMCMIDVSGTDAKEGDEVIVFGENPSISELAEKVGTIPYEILTGVSERVKRVFYSE